MGRSRSARDRVYETPLDHVPDKVCARVLYLHGVAAFVGDKCALERLGSIARGANFPVLRQVRQPRCMRQGSVDVVRPGGGEEPHGLMRHCVMASRRSDLAEPAYQSVPAPSGSNRLMSYSNESSSVFGFMA